MVPGVYEQGRLEQIFRVADCYVLSPEVHFRLSDLGPVAIGGRQGVLESRDIAVFRLRQRVRRIDLE